MCAAQGGTALRARGCDAGACTGRSVSLTSSLTYTSSSLPVREGAPHATSDDARLHSRTPTTGDADGATPAAGAPAGSAAARIQMSLPISVASAQSSSEARGADSIATRGAELLQQGAVEGAADVAAAARGQPRLDARWAAVPSPNQVPFCAISACCRRVHARTGKQSLVANQRGGPVEKYSDFALPRLCLGLIRLIQTLWRQSFRPPRSDALVVLLVACLNADAMQHTAAPAEKAGAAVCGVRCLGARTMLYCADALWCLRWSTFHASLENFGHGGVCVIIIDAFARTSSGPAAMLCNNVCLRASEPHHAWMRSAWFA